MAFEEAHGVFGDGEFWEAEAGGNLLDEILGQEADVLGSLAEGRKLDANDVEPVEEIFSETAFGDFLFEVLVGGGDDADVGADDLVASDARELAVLQDAEDFRLELDGHVADLVEEEGASVALFEAACALRDSAGEGAFFVPKKLTFKELFGDGRAVDSDVGLVVAL